MVRERSESYMITDNEDKLCFSAVSVVLQCIHKLLQTVSALLTIPGLYPDEEEGGRKKKEEVRTPL